MKKFLFDEENSSFSSVRILCCPNGSSLRFYFLGELGMFGEVLVEEKNEVAHISCSIQGIHHSYNLLIQEITCSITIHEVEDGILELLLSTSSKSIHIDISPLLRPLEERKSSKNEQNTISKLVSTFINSGLKEREGLYNEIILHIKEHSTSPKRSRALQTLHMLHQTKEFDVITYTMTKYPKIELFQYISLKSLHNVIISQKHPQISFGELFQGGSKATLPICIKTISKQFYDDAKACKIFGAYTLMQHPNIIYFYGIVTNLPLAVGSQWCMVTQHVEDSLDNIVEKGQFELFPQEKKIRFVRQIAAALAYLHHHDIIHNSINMEHILVGNNEPILGLPSCHTADAHRYLHSRTQNLCYLAPEIINLQCTGSKSSDVYALGVLVWSLFSKESASKFKRKHFSFRKDPISKIIQKCTHSNPTKRISMANLIILFLHMEQDCVIKEEEDSMIEVKKNRKKREILAQWSFCGTIGVQENRELWNELLYDVNWSFELLYINYVKGVKDNAYLTVQEVRYQVHFDKFVLTLPGINTVIFYLQRTPPNSENTTSIIYIESERDGSTGVSFSITGNTEDVSDVIISARYTFLNNEGEKDFFFTSKSPFEYTAEIQPEGWIVIQILLSNNKVLNSEFKLDSSQSKTKKEYPIEEVTEPNYIENRFPSFESLSSCAIENIIQKAKSLASLKLKTLYKEIMVQVAAVLHPNSHSHDDISYEVYGGVAGLAYILWRLKKSNYEEEVCMKEVSDIISLCEENIMGQDSTVISFLIGASGVHALSAAIHLETGDMKKVKRSIHLLCSTLQSENQKLYENELLYGYAGYLMSIMFMINNVPSDLYDTDVVEDLIRLCFDALCGTAVSFQFQNSNYFGAAHGLSGVLHALFYAPGIVQEKKYRTKIEDSLKLLLRQEQDGSFMCSEESDDISFQWCHGSPGIISTLLQSQNIFPNEEVKNIITRAIDRTWGEGILKKGFSFCHGIAGNSFTFLHAYQETKNRKYLYFASQYLLCYEESRIFLQTIPRLKKDSFSLMEGKIGEGNFCLNLLNPDTATFPGFHGDVTTFINKNQNE